MNLARTLLAALFVLQCQRTVVAGDAPPGPAYQIILRSRHAEATPTRTRDAQTGGGVVLVEQPEPNTIIVTMGGSAVAGSDFHGSAAAIAFTLEQDLEIIPLRKSARAPRIGMIGRVVGTMQVSDPGRCCCKPCGTAEQGPAIANLAMDKINLLSLGVHSTMVSCAQESSINFREGPVECVSAPGCYHLSAAFRIAVNQGKGCWHRQYAVADFDPAPQLDAFWADALRPFRAVPRRDFGFKVIVRVVEDAGVELGAAK